MDGWLTGMYGHGKVGRCVMFESDLMFFFLGGGVSCCVFFNFLFLFLSFFLSMLSCLSILSNFMFSFSAHIYLSLYYHPLSTHITQHFLSSSPNFSGLLSELQLDSLFYLFLSLSILSLLSSLAAVFTYLCTRYL